MGAASRAIGLIAMLVGFAFASWAPRAFVAISGRPLPVPRSEDAIPMIAWSGVAFARAFGAVLLGLGAVLWITARGRRDDAALHKVLFASSVFATLVVLAQQVAIWSNVVGFVLVGILASIAVATGVDLLWSTTRPGQSRVG